MTTFTTPDLISDLVDLTAIPLDELRDLHTPALDDAIHRTFVKAASNSGNELQDQRR